jgi:protein TonB
MNRGAKAPTGFFERRTASPTALGLIVLAHAGLLGALALVKPTIFTRIAPVDTVTTFIPLPPDPPPAQPQAEDRLPQAPSSIDTPPIVIDLPPVGPIVDRGETPPLPPIGGVGPEPVPEVVRDPPPPPVRVAAQFDPRFASEVQPPYPPSEHRAQRSGTVRIQVTIGVDGRVVSVTRLAATSDAFWRATERHALARWRFRPATVDGRPIESSKVMNVFFRIEDV